MVRSRGKGCRRWQFEPRRTLRSNTASTEPSGLEDFAHNVYVGLKQTVFYHKRRQTIDRGRVDIGWCFTAGHFLQYVLVRLGIGRDELKVRVVIEIGIDPPHAFHKTSAISAQQVAL